MKYIIISLLIILNIFTAWSKDIIDTYSFFMRIKVPKIFDNMQSLGRRKYVNQLVKGELKIIYRDGVADEIVVTNLVNKSHKINGQYVSYDCRVSDVISPRLSYIGDNKTNNFKTPNIVFYLEADPSYNIGELNEDNSLYILISGMGFSSTELDNLKGYQIIRKLNGYLSGTLGCGCHAYGHISPTRLVGPYGFVDQVTDVAAVHGFWTAKWSSRSYK